ncbi:PKD domain-containing protein [Stieleria sp. ICT_E10.1]|uniref:PKD domain-containing protein n=1 Tax=Stieleria sedimenti TaxID=2976331 RepID=UPI002180100C|nr:PKD domain-containing protein [Stieleria sedimenti]MCS7466572.1 PKD domain-containing protein [Stieleria sedimenti]
MRNLQNVLIEEYGLGDALAGWRLRRALAISEDGLIITGHGINPSGATESFVVDLDLSSDVGNQTPTADVGADQTLNDAGGNGDGFVMLTGSGSDSDGEVVSYEWRQGSTILGTTADITPTLPIGNHELTLTVTDNEGASSTDTVVVTVDEVDIKPVKVFILAGQSNMTGTASADNLDPSWNVPQDDVWIWLDHNMDGGQWTTVTPGHGWGTHAPRPEEAEGLDSRNGL